MTCDGGWQQSGVRNWALLVVDLHIRLDVQQPLQKSQVQSLEKVKFLMAGQALKGKGWTDWNGKSLLPVTFHQQEDTQETSHEVISVCRARIEILIQNQCT